MTLDPATEARLDAAAVTIVARWRELATDAVSQDEVAAVVAQVVAEVSAGSAADREAHPATPLHRRVTGRLRRELLADAGSTLAVEQLLILLRALERVADSQEAGWSERFQDRLTGPSGLDLVVEVAHDLRSPLTSILFLAETMIRGRSGPLTALQERQLGLVYSAAFGLNAVASDVIELVRGGDRLVSREAQPFSVAEVLESVGDIVLPIAEEKGLNLTFTSPEHDHRIGHPAAINRVLLNLTTNALKFTSEGGVFVELQEYQDDPARLRCRVRDTGRGIPEAAMATLFEPFRRRQQAGDYAFSGSGLGLSICRKMVEAMGSELTVRTEQGKGTTFAFDLDLPLGETGG
ncbi:MAG TPA: HAMP domain-containing sensor histidine kinase [Gemmatimonadales bacterium]|nr:HAMP domain-containing sensor histidine kinase [Gemmatimonadales bacterium]